MTGTADAIVIGGGVIGLSSALHMARAGLKVALFERDWVGRQASGATAAGVRSMNRKPVEIPLALAANALWHQMPELVGDTCGFHADGVIKAAETEDGMDVLRARHKLSTGMGYDHEELIGPDELYHLVPDLVPGCAGGMIVRRDGAADPHRTTRAFRKAAQALGVAIHEQAGVTGAARAGGDWTIKTTAGHCTAPVVVNAAGAWGRNVAGWLGEDLPLSWMTPMMIVTERTAPFLKPVMSFQGRKLSFKQSDKGTLLLGGGYQGVSSPETGIAQPDVTKLHAPAGHAVAMFPHIRGLRVARVWAGIEASTADKLPILERSTEAPGVIHAVGFSGHGFQPAPMVGQLVSELAIGATPSVDVAPYSRTRLLPQG